jgi:hypothetical protein
MANLSYDVNLTETLTEWGDWWYGIEELSKQANIGIDALNALLDRMYINGQIEAVENPDRSEVGYFLKVIIHTEPFH